MATIKPTLWASNLAVELVAIVHEKPHADAVKLIAHMLDAVNLTGQRQGIAESMTILTGAIPPCPTENSKP